MTIPDLRRKDRAAQVGDAEDARRVTAATGWGIGHVWWLWATQVRILIVKDGRITASSDSMDFGLGPVLDTLSDGSFAWWVRFFVAVVDRDDGFRFTQSGFNFDDVDQVWFFGDWPGLDANASTVTDDIIGHPQYSPLDDDELRLLAEWMDRGGGVFAAGDHTLLGASMCSRIPRVRTMRKWTHAQGVPSFNDADRHETLQHGPGSILAWEGDRYPQRISPVYRSHFAHPLVFEAAPHPLLCGQNGILDRFPDHMHEGVVVEDDDVELDEPLGIPGYAGVEYPPFPEVFDPTTAVEPGLVRPRPRPHVIAHGWTTNTDANPRRFGLIGVYDGDPVKIGRVVVESTWHHWFSYNLAGFRSQAPADYRAMQHYYRNVALWLSTPEQRASMLFAATWGVLVGSQPGAFDQVMSIWEIGERVVDVIGRTAPQCILSELVAAFDSVDRFASTEAHGETAERRRNRHRPHLALSAAVVNQAIVGGIAKELLGLAHHHIVERARGRHSVLNPDQIRRHGLAGLAAGRRELIATLADGAAELAALRDVVTYQVDRDTMGEIPIYSDLGEAGPAGHPTDSQQRD
jgi:hypothetical protein